MYHFPPPTHEQEFQDLVAGVLEEAYGHPVTQVGRRGQSQGGIDLLLQMPAGISAEGVPATLIGIQCKKREHRLTAEDITRDIRLFKQNWVRESIRTCVLWVCTTAPADANLQLAIKEFTEIEQLRFDVRIFFWQDFERLLTHKAPNARRKFYQGAYYPWASDDEDGVPVVPRQRPTDVHLTTAARAWQQANALPPNSVLLDHATLGLASDLLASGVSGTLFSNFHYSALDQLIEALVLNETVCLPRALHPARWERGPSLAGVSDVIRYLDCPPSLDDDINDASVDWALNFWSSRSSRGFLSKLLHTHIAMHYELTPPGSTRNNSLSMLANESRSNVRTLCRQLWRRFEQESTHEHRTLLGGQMLSPREWNETLDRLAPVCLSLIYWMFYRTFYYNCVGVAVGGVPYFCNPLRSSVIAFEASGRDSSVSSRVISLIKTEQKRYTQNGDLSSRPTGPYWRACLPPVTHFVLNRCGGNLNDIVPVALALREESPVVELRAELAEMHRVAMQTPTALVHKLNAFERHAAKIRLQWNVASPNGHFVTAVRRGRPSSRSSSRPVPPHLAFFKSLIESIQYNNYIIPFFCPSAAPDVRKTSGTTRRARIVEANKNRTFAGRSGTRREKLAALPEQMRKARRQVYIDFDAGQRTLQTRSLIVQVFGGYGS